MFLGLRTVIYPAPDLSASRTWYAELLSAQPYFDQPFYVAFSVGGYELGLDPEADVARGPVTYWGVRDAADALAQLLAAGAGPDSDGVREVGEGIKVATVREVGGGVFGIIENPHFALAAPPTSAEGATGAGK